MSKKRASLGLKELNSPDIIETEVNIEELANFPKKPKITIDTEAIKKVAIQSGFVSREATPSVSGIRKKGAYTTQINFKAKPGVKEIVKEASAHLQYFEHTIFEQALLALLEKEALIGLVNRLNTLIK